MTVKDNPEVITSATLTPENLLNWNGTDNVAYAADEIESTIAGLKFGAAGCGVYGNGIQMRTNATTGTSAFYNKDAIPGGIAKITLNWAASKDVSVKDYHLFVEFSNSADFGTLVGEKINAKFTEKALELTPTASATFFRVTHANMGAVYLDSVVIDFVVE